MKFAIISDIHLGEESEHKGVIRKMSRHSMQFLREFVEKVRCEIQPEFVVNLGDSINDVSHDVDLANLEKVLKVLKQTGRPVLNLVGNHEQWTMSKEELESALGIESLYYSTDIGGFHAVILFSEAFQGEDSKIGEKQKMWLRDDLAATNLPALIFVHHPLADQNLTGNFWFEGKPNRALVGNRAKVREVLEKSGKVRAVFNGHVHWNNMMVHNGIPYITITSIVENFRNDDTPSSSYAVVEIDEASLSVAIGGADSCRYKYSFNEGKKLSSE